MGVGVGVGGVGCTAIRECSMPSSVHRRIFFYFETDVYFVFYFLRRLIHRQKKPNDMAHSTYNSSDPRLYP